MKLGLWSFTLIASAALVFSGLPIEKPTIAAKHEKHLTVSRKKNGFVQKG